MRQPVCKGLCQEMALDGPGFRRRALLSSACIVTPSHARCWPVDGLASLMIVSVQAS